MRWHFCLRTSFLRLPSPTFARWEARWSKASSLLAKRIILACKKNNHCLQLQKNYPCLQKKSSLLAKIILVVEIEIRSRSPHSCWQRPGDFAVRWCYVVTGGKGGMGWRWDYLWFLTTMNFSAFPQNILLTRSQKEPPRLPQIPSLVISSLLSCLARAPGLLALEKGDNVEDVGVGGELVISFFNLGWGSPPQ